MSIKAWNDEQEAELIKLYKDDGVKDVHKLASHFSKGYRSVISKLVQLKMYEKPEIEEEEPLNEPVNEVEVSHIELPTETVRKAKGRPKKTN